MRSITLANQNYKMEVKYDPQEDVVTVMIQVEDGEILELEMDKDDALELIDTIKQVLE